MHVGDDGPSRDHGSSTIARLEGGSQIVEPLLDRRTVRALARLASVEPRTDVLKLAKNLRHAVRARAETAKREIRTAGVATLPRAGQPVLLNTGVQAVRGDALTDVPPRFDEKARDKRGLGLCFRECLTGVPMPNSLLKPGGLVRVGERPICIMPNGEQEAFVK
ncbi:MAG: hypothetical protein WCG22_04430 [Lentisphaerota bacterium]